MAYYEQWSARMDEAEAVQRSAREEGGPRPTLVPDPVSMPSMLRPDIVDPGSGHEVVFVPEPSPRGECGWSAQRQRQFIDALAQTGAVHVAAKAAGLSARSAYALRVRSATFARAWDAAQQLAVGRLSALAFDRAIHGRVEQVYRDGELVAERKVPSDRLLMWLLARLDPRRFAMPWEHRGAADGADPMEQARATFPALIADLRDTADELHPIAAAPPDAWDD